MTQEEFYTHLDQLYEAGDAKEIERFLTFHIDLYKDGETTNRPLLIAALTELGVFYRETDRLKESASRLEEALTWIAIVRGKDSLPYATTLNNTAMTYRKMGKTAEAKACLEAARELFEQHKETSHPLYASVLNNLALVYMEEGQKAEGIKLLEKSLDILNRQPDR